MKQIVCFSLALGCSSCATDLSKIETAGPSVFASGLTQLATLESTLITEFQNEDRILRYLSAGKYSCGEPEAERVRAALRIKDPTRFIEERNKKAAWQGSIDTITAYAANIKSILETGTADEALIKALGGAIKSVAALVPAVSTFSSAAEPVAAALGNIRRFGTQIGLQNLAITMRGPLTEAVSFIDSNYPSLSVDEETAFGLWDACARERLIFIRDVSLGRVKNYVPLGAQSSGIELANAYSQYLEKRRQYRKPPDIRDLLQKVLKYNEELSKAAQQIDTPSASASFFTTVDSIATATQAVSKSVEERDKKLEEDRKKRRGL